jgi:serine/threonine protein phosphatase 1
MTLTYAIGDIHGALHKLQELVAICERHADGQPLKFVFVGDYVDRGPDCAGVVRFLIDLQTRLPDRVVTLRGNHEAILLAIADGTLPQTNWYWQGGAATLHSYNVSSVSELPRAHVDWMRALPSRHDDGRRFFVHAGIDPDRPLGAQSDFDMMWIREPFLSDGRDYGRLIVHGHTPLTDGAADLRSNRVNIDTGAVFGGPLTAAIFDEAVTPPIGFLQAK